MIADALQRIWYDEATPPWWLRMLEAPFRAGVALRRRRYVEGARAVARFETPVIVVGNLSVGGTGKTPLVIALARALRERGYRVGVLTRGYGARLAAPVVLDASGAQGVAGDAAAHGDEPALIARATGVPVAVSPERVAAATRLIEAGAEVLLSDDGLQHYRLGRSLELAVIDGARALGNGHLLPAGPLREPAERLREVDWLVVNGEPSAACAALLASLSPQRDVLGMRLRTTRAEALTPGDATPSRPLEQFRGRRVHAVAGIGHPARFFEALRAAGLDLIEHPFADHHAYVARDLDFGDDRAILMTEKDGVKCAGFGLRDAWQVPAEPEFEPLAWAKLLAQIDAQVRTAEAARSS